MAKVFKSELILEGLNCANCAAKIEANVNNLANVNSASLSFATKTLIIETEKEEELSNIVETAKSIVKNIEPEVVVKEKQLQRKSLNKENITFESKKSIFILEGLNCANCAAKIENQVLKLDHVKEAALDFVSKRMRVEVEDTKYMEQVYNEIVSIVKSTEPDVKVYLEKGSLKDSKPALKEEKGDMVKLALGAAFFAVALIFDFSFNIELILYVISYVLIGGEVLVNAFKNIKRGQVFDENFLMSVATLGAFAIKEFPEAVSVMLFYQIGELFQDLAVDRSRKSIAELMNIRPDFANVKRVSDFIKVAPEEVKVGDMILVKPGEKIPLDGVIIEGDTMVDTSALTGESVPRKVKTGDEVLGGFINKNGLIQVEVQKEFGETTVAKILDLVQNAGAKKAPTEKFITKFARYYTPIVVFSALALAFIPPLIIQDATFTEWIYRALVFLVVSCPCALVVSIPLGFFGGIGAASRHGILIKGGNYLEALNKVETVVFDKTGTLTKGIFDVTEMHPQSWVSSEDLLKYAAYVESYSNHPIALSIMKAYGQEIDKSLIENYEEVTGLGIIARFKNETVFAGNDKLMITENIPYASNVNSIGTLVHLAVDKKYAGYIVISDEIKEDSKEALKKLKASGVKNTIMLTGDRKKVGEMVGEYIGIDEVYSELLPEQKVEKLELIDKGKSSKGKLAFVGDGINDAPVLARADIGIAMGGVGSDAAIEAADVVIMTDEPSKIVTAINVAKYTQKVVWQNIIFALIVKIIILVLGALGIANMWEAVFGDVGVALIAVLNSMRVLKDKEK